MFGDSGLEISFRRSCMWRNEVSISDNNSAACGLTKTLPGLRGLACFAAVREISSVTAACTTTAAIERATSMLCLLLLPALPAASCQPPLIRHRRDVPPTPLTVTPTNAACPSRRPRPCSTTNPISPTSRAPRGTTPRASYLTPNSRESLRTLRLDAGSGATYR